MKKTLPLVLRTLVLGYALLTTLLSVKIRQWASVRFNLTAETIIIAILFVIGGAALCATIIKCPLKCKVDRIGIVIIIAVGVTATILLSNTFGMSYITLFASAAYLFEALGMKLSEEQKGT